MSASGQTLASLFSHIVVKFHDGIGFPYDDDVAEHIRALDANAWRDLSGDFQGINFRRLFASVTPSGIRELEDRAVRNDRTYSRTDLLSYFIVDIEPEFDLDELLVTLRRLLPLDFAYLDVRAEDPTVLASDDSLFSTQGYLTAAPLGIDAQFAWKFAGGDGAGQEFTDLEKGWTTDHEDLVAHNIQLLNGTVQDSSRPHGTQVLGVVCASDNKVGVVGVAPNVGDANVVSYYDSNRPDAMMAAISHLSYGSVLLLEAQLPSLSSGTNTFYMVPIELLRADFDVIRLATALGITVVEAGGNGANNLSNVTDPDGKHVLNKNDSDYRDSGAIVVGAATSDASHAPVGTTNHGGRVDCFAWGENVSTTDSSTSPPYDTQSYWAGFKETSSAAAIIAGSALAVQGIAQENLKYRFNALQMRALLSNPGNGTLSKDPAADEIGVMPDLRKIINGDEIGLAPDLYIRDYVGDDGSPHTAMISASPDIILRPLPEIDPQAAFGENSGSENSATLGHVATAGQDNYIYARVRNRGGSTAQNARVDVYWAPVSTLVTPDMWNFVGSASLPSVQAADQLTVFNAITWPAGAIPASGHYCFVGVVGSDSDPPPVIPAQPSWDDFRRLIRDNNNVTWRNFNVVDNQPAQGAQPAGFAALDFIVSGAPDSDQHMCVDAFARLPVGSRAMLEVPVALYECVSERVPGVSLEQHEPHQLVRIPMNPHGRRTLEDVFLRRASRYPVRLLIHVPEEFRDNAYEVHVRQTQEGLEVGRVTWRLCPNQPSGEEIRPEAIRRTTPMKLVEKVSETLKAEGFNDAQIAKVATAIAENFPPRTYIVAVWFLGGITVILVLGALYYLSAGQSTEAIWVAVGAGIGALAGIFSAKE